MQISCWGHHEYEGMDFYIEPGFEVPEFCDIKLPPKHLRCPHQGLNASTKRDWEKLAYIGTDDIEKIRTLLPEDLNVVMDLTFISPFQILHRPYLITNLTKLTNALPVFVFGVTLSMNYQRLFEILRSTACTRPIYVCGSTEIPVPKEFTKINLGE